MSKSPWDILPDENPDDAVADSVPDLPDFTPQSFAKEAETWRARAHVLWASARKDGNLQAQAAALNSAFRGLKDQADADEAAKAASSNQDGISEETRKKIALDTLDGVAAATEDFYRKHRTLCPTCHGQGDRLRIRRFEKWLNEQGTKAMFDDWNARTPYQMSNSLEEKGGFYLDDEISNSNTPN